jgi:hypothetical protein
MSIRDMEMLGIGSPNDVGGTETKGTINAKLNAILKELGYPRYVVSDTVQETLYETQISPEGFFVAYNLEAEYNGEIRISFNASSGASGTNIASVIFVLRSSDIMVADTYPGIYTYHDYYNALYSPSGTQIRARNYIYPQIKNMMAFPYFLNTSGNHNTYNCDWIIPVKKGERVSLSMLSTSVDYLKLRNLKVMYDVQSEVE